MKKLVLFGAGQEGENLYSFLKDYHYEGQVYAFCDNDPNKRGGNLFGKDIISVEELRKLEDTVCVICVSNQYKNEIEKQLKQENIFYYDNIVDCFSIEFGIEESQFENVYYSYFNREKGLKIYEVSEEYIRAQQLIDKSENMIDLGCGTLPHPKAKVAVDKYIEPLHRKYGQNESINTALMENREIKFVKADFENLPFEDKEFDVAYSHHVIEHLDDPRNGLNEMMRIATAGVIMCPSIFSEYIFGRKYHKWMVTAQNNTLIFIEKDWENLWFGEGPWIKDGVIHFNADVNPFDVLLNDGDWYHGEEQYKRLTEQMRKYWYGHYKNMETCFVWENDFDYLIIYKNGDFYSSKGGIE